MIRDALPWTVGLLGVTTVFSFAAGTLLGALLAWPGAPRWMQWIMPPLWATARHSVFSILGLVLMFLFAFQIQLLPIFGGYSAGANASLSWTFALDVPAACCAAGAIHCAGVGRRLGAVDAWNDGHHHGRGLRYIRRGEGAAELYDLHAGTVSAMRSCRRRQGWRWPWDRSCPAQCWWRSFSVIRASERCCFRRSKRTTSF